MRNTGLFMLFAVLIIGGHYYIQAKWGPITYHPVQPIITMP